MHLTRWSRIPASSENALSVGPADSLAVIHWQRARAADSPAGLHLSVSVTVAALGVVPSALTAV